METRKITNKKRNKPSSAVNKALDLIENCAGSKTPHFSAQFSIPKTRRSSHRRVFVIHENKEKPKEMVKEKSRDNFLYVYGIIAQGSFKLDMKGLKNQPIRKIDFEDISALVSFYPHLHPAVEEDEAMHHAEILNKLAQKTTIIPMAFGTVFKEQEILETVLAKTYPTIEKTLASIKGKIELGVKVVKKESEDVSGETSQKILEELSPLSVKSLAGDKFSDRLVLNQSFLVDKNKFSHFSSKIAGLEKKYPDLKFRYTGPWPAYSFVNINIGVE